MMKTWLFQCFLFYPNKPARRCFILLQLLDIIMATTTFVLRQSWIAYAPRISRQSIKTVYLHTLLNQSLDEREKKAGLCWVLSDRLAIRKRETWLLWFGSAFHSQIYCESNKFVPFSRRIYLNIHNGCGCDWCSFLRRFFFFRMKQVISRQVCRVEIIIAGINVCLNLNKMLTFFQRQWMWRVFNIVFLLHISASYFQDNYGIMLCIIYDSTVEEMCKRQKKRIRQTNAIYPVSFRFFSSRIYIFGGFIFVVCAARGCEAGV